tara:strand:- start:581 stop:1588 length:1008 start_codon:yes stop_codon:yes gene_type:complete
MKKIGVTIGTEIEPISKGYYKKHKKIFDEVMEELELESTDEISYDIQQYALIKKFASKNIEVVPLWKLEYTKKDLDELDLIYVIYESTFVLRDYGSKGVKKYKTMMKNTKSIVTPDSKFQEFVLSKKTYMSYFKKKNIPIMDTIFYNINKYKKNKSEANKLINRIQNKFEGPIYCKPELGAFAQGSKMFKNITLTSFKKYLDSLIKYGYQDLLIQPYVSEFLKFYEIKTIWMNGKYQYAYGTKVLANSEDAQEKDLDQKLLKELKKKGKEVIDILSKDFNLPFIIRIDWGCCLMNDNVCRDYFLNEIECAPTMGANDKVGLDFFARLGKEIVKKV